jgi:hypothetical protein
MPREFLPSLAIWAVLAIAVLILAIRRWLIARREDDVVHIHDGDDTILQQQTVIASKLKVVEKWGIALTIVMVVYGMALAAWALYAQWVRSASL